MLKTETSPTKLLPWYDLCCCHVLKPHSANEECAWRVFVGKVGQFLHSALVKGRKASSICNGLGVREDLSTYLWSLFGCWPLPLLTNPKSSLKYTEYPRGVNLTLGNTSQCFVLQGIQLPPEHKCFEQQQLLQPV